MSFGFSIGDFVTVIERAISIRKSFVDSPAQFQYISDEVRNLLFVLQDLDVDLSSTILSDHQQTELRGIEKSCRDLVSELEGIIDQYSVLSPSSAGQGHKARRVWKRLIWEPGHIGDLRARISSNITLLNAMNVRTTKNHVGELLQSKTKEENQALLNWLSPDTYTALQCHYICQRQRDTGRWLLESPEFQAWIESPQQTLFCPGIPGAGKTVLASIVIEELQARFGSDGNTGIAFAYCSFQRHEEQTVRRLLASLIQQLVQDLIPVPDSIRESYDNHLCKRTRPSADELSRALRSVVGQFSRVFIVIDALDECQSSGGSRIRIIDEVFNLQADYNLNFFATSRSTPEIDFLFQKKPTRRIQAARSDILKYLNANLEELPPFVSRYPDLQQDITVGIADAAEGMFLLARLYLNSLLGKTSIRAIRSTLKELLSGSKSYDSAYENSMKRIEAQVPDRRELAKRVLSWITCAKRQLSKIELQNALAVELGELKFHDDNLPEINDMVSACAGLVTVDEESQTIRLVHYTANEYFKRSWTRWFPEAHRDIATICVTYLSFDIFQLGPCSTDAGFETRLAEYPLYSFAAANWGYHMREQLMHEEAILKFLDETPKMMASIQGAFARKSFTTDYQYSQQAPQDFTPLHLAAYFGLESVVRALIHRGDQPDLKDSESKTPLSWAAENGYEAIVELLLRIDVDADPKDKSDQTPLLCAARNGHSKVVQLLLNAKADPDVRDKFGKSPLSWAARDGHEKIASLLLDEGVNPDSRDEFHRAPISWAAFNGHMQIVRSLLQNGACLNINNDKGPGPLSWAAYKGHVPVVELLLEMGADPDCPDMNGQTPLSWAASNGSIGVINLLLEKGVDTDSKDKTGRSPFSWAAGNNQISAMKLLLVKEIDPNSQDEEGQTPLSWAAFYGHKAAMQLLLDRNDDATFETINAKGFLKGPQFEVADRIEEEKLSIEIHPPRLPRLSPPLAGRVQKGLERQTQHSQIETGAVSDDVFWQCLLCSADQRRTYKRKEVITRHIKVQHYPKVIYYCTFDECRVSRPIGRAKTKAIHHYLLVHKIMMNDPEPHEGCRQPHPSACSLCHVTTGSWDQFYACVLGHCEKPSVSLSFNEDHDEIMYDV